MSDIRAYTPASGLAHCGKCDLKENLWLCLTCGNLGCGRSQYGGLGGNSHGLVHFEESHHPVSVKLGTITAEGTAGEYYKQPVSCSHSDWIEEDVYCYSCNEERIDPELAGHLGSFGINIHTRKKTEKSVTELVCQSIWCSGCINLHGILSKSNITSTLISE